MIRYTRTITFIPGILLALSCSPGHHGSSKDEVSQRVLSKGKVLPNVTCLKDPSISYALYLPKNYNTAGKFPMILAFDPHASGSLPVERYKDLAEKFGYILMGSNNSKNGQPESETSTITSTLFKEVFSQFSVDTNRIYLMGFSGGARIASLIGLYHDAIAGVICCGAGLPGTDQPIKKKCDFIGFAGKGDFNMFELLNLNDQLENNGFRHALVLFDGIHFWPPEAVMQDAFYWSEFCAMKEKLIPLNDKLTGNFISAKDEILKNDEENRDLLKEYDDLKNVISFLDGLANIDKFKEQFKSLGEMAIVRQGLKNRGTLMEKELQQQKLYSNSFFVKDLKWWKKEITNWGLRVTNYKKPEDTLAARRMLSYLSLVAYMRSNRALNENDTTNARYALQIYEWVDPDNTEVYYLSALLNARKGNRAGAFIEMKKAIDKGFNDKPRIQQQPEFQTLLSDREFYDLLQKIK